MPAQGGGTENDMKTIKRLLTLTVICSMLLCSISAFATAESITINNEAASIPSDMGKICEMNDRTYVPIRFVMEYLGCVVNYQETKQSQDNVSVTQRTATVTNPKTNLSYFMTVGDDKIYIISDVISSVQMDTPIFVNDDEGRMYVPIRFLAQALGYTVDWDEESQTVSLKSAE